MLNSQVASSSFRPSFEVGVPIPVSKFSGRPAEAMPFALDELEAGQSCFIPVAAFDHPQKNVVTKNLKTQLNRFQNYLTTKLRTHRSVKGRKFATRQQGDGVRVWRLS